MGSMDSVMWQVLTVTLTVAALVTSVLLWRLRGPASGLRGIAWSLLPAAAYLTGVLELLWRVGDAAVTWAVGFAFSPRAWLGVAVAGVSVALFVVAGVMRRRGAGGRDRRGKPVEGGESRALPGSQAPKSSPDDDMDEIEAILRKHGIS